MSFKDLKKYDDHQVILTSGRLVFNAKTDNIFLIANKDVAVSAADSMHINLGDKLVVNSPLIQFGLVEHGMEPVAKGNSLVDTLTTIIDELTLFLQSASTAKGLVLGGVAYLTTLNIASDQFLKKLPNIKEGLTKIKSDITFTN